LNEKFDNFNLLVIKVLPESDIRADSVFFRGECGDINRMSQKFSDLIFTTLLEVHQI
jgi:hypothetical protein